MSDEPHRKRTHQAAASPASPASGVLPNSRYSAGLAVQLAKASRRHRFVSREVAVATA